MPRIFLTPIRRVVQIVVAVGDQVEFLHRAAAGLQTSLRITQRGTQILAGLTVATRQAVRIVTAAAVTVATSAAGTVRALAAPAALLTTRLAAGRITTALPAGKITQVVVSGTLTRFAATATNTGAQTFTNPTNAQGANNGTVATLTSQALAATNGTLQLDYDDVTGKDSLTITSVTLLFHASLTEALLSTCTMQLQYRLGPSDAWGTLATYDATIDGSAGIPFTITGVVGGDWQKVRDLQVRVVGSLSAGLGSTVTVDAVRLRVLASRTDTF